MPGPNARRVLYRSGLAAMALLAITAYFLTRLFALGSSEVVWNLVVDTVTSREFITAAMVGLLAQTIDGALGMAYGLTATTFLMGTGVSPAVATARSTKTGTTTSSRPTTGCPSRARSRRSPA